MTVCITARYRSWDMPQIPYKFTKSRTILRAFLGRTCFLYLMCNKQLSGKPVHRFVKKQYSYFCEWLLLSLSFWLPESNNFRIKLSILGRENLMMLSSGSKKLFNCAILADRVITICECGIGSIPIGFDQGLGKPLREGWDG